MTMRVKPGVSAAELSVNGHRTQNSPTIPTSATLSNLQWYLARSGNTVFFAAESDDDLTESELESLTGQALTLAPHLMSKVGPRGDQHVQVDVAIKEICQFQRTENLQLALAETLGRLDAAFDDPQLPQCRAIGFQVDDPEPGEPRSLILVLSTHALTEGAETSRIVRARPQSSDENQPATRQKWTARVAVFLGSKVLALLHLLASAFNTPDDGSRQWTIIDLDRKSVQRLSRQLNVRQRSLLFSLPLFCLQPKALDGGKRQKPQAVSYSMLPKTSETIGDAALRFRMQIGRFPAADCFEDYVQMTDTVLGKENLTESFGPALYDSILGFHRRLQKVFPFLYGKRFFTFVPYDMVLSLVPPHFASGPFQKNLNRPIHCGSYSPGVNSCVIVPHRTGFSLNLFLDHDAKENVGVLTSLLDANEIPYRQVL